MKRRFEFRLERVAHVRRLEEQVARAERAGAEAEARRAEERRDLARAGLERSRSSLVAGLLGRLRPRAVLAAQHALDAEQRGLERRVESARTRRRQAERLAAAHRARQSAARALEELRARAQVRHRAALESWDNAALDEVAQQRARTARRGEGKPASDSSPAARESDRGSGPAPSPRGAAA